MEFLLAGKIIELNHGLPESHGANYHRVMGKCNTGETYGFPLCFRMGVPVSLFPSFGEKMASTLKKKTREVGG